MNIINKTGGVAICLVGMVVWYADYLIFRTSETLAAHADSLIPTMDTITFGAMAFGFTTLGVMVIGWFLALGLIATALFIIGVVIEVYGIQKIIGR